MFAGFVLVLLLSMVALVLSLLALLAPRARPGSRGADERVAALEEQVRGLLYRVWTLEGARPASPAPAPSPPAPEPSPTVPVPPVAPAPPPMAPPPAPPPAPAGTRPSLDLEQRIGARWATWVGIVVILVAVALFLKWAFDNDYLGAATRVGVGVVVGLLMLVGGLALHRRRDVPYLSEGLSGGGLGVLYLSLFAAHALYGLLGPAAAFAAMFAVTLLGALVAVLSSRFVTAVLAVLGGLLTPVLLRVEQPDELNLLAYLLVLDALALFVARFRTWVGLNRLAWAGTALLLLPTLRHEAQAPRPLARLLFLSALFLVFLAVPLFRERAERRRGDQIDLVLVVANAAAYFWAVYVTLDAWRPGVEGPYALGLAVLYRLVAADYAARVPDDEVTVMVHEGVGWTFLTLAIPLALDGQWITLAWAVQGVMLLWLATRARAPVALWGGLVAMLLAGVRVVVLDRDWGPDANPVGGLTLLIHFLVVAAMAIGGALAGRAREAGSADAGRVLRATLWVAAAVTLAVLFWREPSGLWPATLLTAELVVLGWLAPRSSSPAFVVATPLIALAVAARVLGADDGLARAAADSLVNLPLLSRVAACAGIALAGGGLARSPSIPRAAEVGRVLSGAAGLMLLFVLSVGWTRYQEGLQVVAREEGRSRFAGELRWRTQVGLSVLWTLYAGVALAWGFVRSNHAVRYAALALLGLTVFKVFAVDLSAVKTAYRILSFLVLGVVLLLVSLAYQKVRGPRGA